MAIKAFKNEILVNTYTDDYQGAPSIDANPANGGFQIVWESEGQDGDGLGVFGQNFKKNGSTRGAEIQLNQLTVGDQRNPDVAFNENGDGAWVWQTNAEYSSTNIDRFAVPVANEFPADNERTHQRTFGFESDLATDQYLNHERVLHTKQDATDTGINYLAPRVVSIGGDQFVAGYYAEDFSHGDLHYQVDLYTANTFEKNTNGSWSRGKMESELGGRNATLFGDLAKIDGSNLLTVATLADDTDGTNGVIQFQVMQGNRGRPFDYEPNYILALVPQDRIVLEGSGQTGKATEPRVVVLKDGGFAITWQEHNETKGNSNNWHWDVYVQIFNDDYTERSPVVNVDVKKGSDQTVPEITALKDGGFLIVWADSNGDGKGSGIEAQRFDENGVKLGDSFVVNSAARGDQIDPAVTTLNNGQVVVTWASEFGDVSNGSVKAQILKMTGVGKNTDQKLVGTSLDERFDVGKGKDDVEGGGGDDILLGGDGKDLLKGGTGDDVIKGGGGNDRIEGGRGDDILYGNGGADKFVFNAGQDTIRDFVDDSDTVIFSKSLAGGSLNKSKLGRIVEEGANKLTFDFGDDNILVIKGINDFDALKDDIGFIA